MPERNLKVAATNARHRGQTIVFPSSGVFRGNSDSVPKQFGRQSSPFRTPIQFKLDSNPGVLRTVYRTGGTVSELIGMDFQE